jgi:hypothetical protein
MYVLHYGLSQLKGDGRADIRVQQLVQSWVVQRSLHRGGPNPTYSVHPLKQASRHSTLSSPPIDYLQRQEDWTLPTIALKKFNHQELDRIFFIHLSASFSNFYISPLHFHFLPSLT